MALEEAGSAPDGGPILVTGAGGGVGSVAVAVLANLGYQVTAVTGAEEFTVIGYIIPGLIAIWIDRQGLVETLSALLTASVVVRLILILVFGAEMLQ